MTHKYTKEEYLRNAKAVHEIMECDGRRALKERNLPPVITNDDT